MLPRLLLLSWILFCFELGVFLLVLPWTSFWEQNYFLYRYPALSAWVRNYYLRGAISGLGLLDIGLAVWYASHFGPTLGRLLESASAESSPRESFTHGPAA